MNWRKIGLFVGIPVFVVVLTIGIYSCNGLHLVDNYQQGFTFDRFSGEIKPLPRTGWFYFDPIKYALHSIDLRPYQLSITANFGEHQSGVAARVLNAKLVKFNPNGLQTFVAWHGRDAGDKLTNLMEIMKCYAFDKDEGRDCPFIEILNEVAPSQVPSQSGAKK